MISDVDDLIMYSRAAGGYRKSLARHMPVACSRALLAVTLGRSVLSPFALFRTCQFLTLLITECAFTFKCVFCL